MTEMRDTDCVMDIASRLQLYGVLSKRPFGSQSNKWTKRFFIIKDGFLLYYPESERKEFEKKRFFNMHPKGVIPLSGCVIEPRTEPGHPFAIHVKSDEVNVTNGQLVLASESEFERDKWVGTLRQAGRVTWKNVQLGDALIQHLENEGLKMAQEKQEYFDQLQTEASALHDEKQKTEELERMKEELEKEKHRIEQLALDLKEEYERLRIELEDTVDLMKTVEDEKQTLHETTDSLQHHLEALEKEKHKIVTDLQRQQSETLQLSQERDTLTSVSESMQQQLQSIETKTQQILEEKRATELRLREKEEKAALLEEEKIAISEHAQSLQESIKDLSTQKAATEAELKEEVMARLEAERRLREAEESLTRLEKAVQQDGTQGRNEQEVREEMVSDVKTLKRFFENLAFEEQLEADKTLMIKSAIHARKTCVRRAQTLRYRATRKNKARSVEQVESRLSGVGGQGKRSNSFDALTDLGMSLLDPLKEVVDMGFQMPHSSSGGFEGPSAALDIL